MSHQMPPTPRRHSHAQSSQASMQHAMAQNPREQRLIGDYIVTQWIGAGSFAVVWKGRHKLHGTEVAIKEIPTDKLNRKLQESLESEIAILKRANHPNIIRLLEIVKSPSRIFLILEYCAGGDLSDYIRRTGRAKEVTARHFMRQLGAGLQVLRANNLIHRDLKPQNLLLSSKDNGAVLKIADFGFARSLQPQGLAETLCGSPLYMAPEILQFQKYDAKADLWSVGAILFELLTGRPPFGGQNHVQLLRNIERTEAFIPANVSADLSDACINMCKTLLRRNPVERLSFEEFFYHPFLDLKSFKPVEVAEIAQRSGPAPYASPTTGTSQPGEGTCSKGGSEITSAGGKHVSSQDECLPFVIDDEHQGPVIECRPQPFADARSDLKAGRAEGNLVAGQEVSVTRAEIGLSSGHSHVHKGSTVTAGTGTTESLSSGPAAGDSSRKGVLVTTRDSGSRDELGGAKGAGVKIGSAVDSQDTDLVSSRDGSLPEALSTDSMECIEREYVVVDAPLRMSSEPVSPRITAAALIGWGRSHIAPVRQSRRSPSPSPPVATPSPAIPVSAPVPIAVTGPNSAADSLGSRGSTPSSHESGEVMEGPSPHPPTRLASLQRSARIISVIAMDKREAQQPLDALAMQLLSLAIWREALRVCHSWAAAAADGEGPSSFQEGPGGLLAMSISLGTGYGAGPEDLADQEAAASAACAVVEREFLKAVEKAEDMARDVCPQESTEMPDAIELVFQSALAVGRASAVEELMGNVSNAAVGYAKASALFQFLLVEAPALPLSPQFVLSPTDQYRLRRYADSVITRQNQCMVLSQQPQPLAHHHHHHVQ